MKAFLNRIAGLRGRKKDKIRVQKINLQRRLGIQDEFTYFYRTDIIDIMEKKEITSFDVLIEIPKGSRNKYEYDFALKKVRYDRMIFSSMMYPADYGFVPETLALDGDPLDVLVLVTEPTFPGCVMEVKPIGVFHMTDEKGPDEKIICVPMSDPIWNKVNNLEELNPHLIKEIEHFFKVYKDLEKKKVDVGGWGDVLEAKEIVANCIQRFVESDIPAKQVSIK